MGRQRGKGEGSIRERKDGRWEARITVGCKPDGQPRQRSVYGKTRQEVAGKMVKLLSKHASGLLTEPSKLTLEEWLDSWLKGRTHLASKTRASYRQMFRHLNDVLGSMKVQAIKPVHVRELYIALAEKKQTYWRKGKLVERDKPLSNRTRRYCAMLLKAALKEAVAMQLIPRNPAEAVKLSMPRVKAKADAWSRAEAEAFLQAARGEIAWERLGGRKAKGKKPERKHVSPEEAIPVPFYPVFYTMLALGLRCGEALGLSWDNVNFEDGTVKVRQALTLPGNSNKPIIKEVKTPRSRRTLYLSPDVLALLREVRERQAVDKALMGSGWGKGLKGSEDWANSNLVFTTSIGTAIHARNLTHSFKRLAELAMVREVRVHDLRHTYASLALQRGVPIELVSERLGHTSIGFTLDTYRHLYECERREAALSLDDLLGRPNQPRAVN